METNLTAKKIAIIVRYYTVVLYFYDGNTAYGNVIIIVVIIIIHVGFIVLGNLSRGDSAGRVALSLLLRRPRWASAYASNVESGRSATRPTPFFILYNFKRVKLTAHKLVWSFAASFRGTLKLSKYFLSYFPSALSSIKMVVLEERLFLTWKLIHA